MSAQLSYEKAIETLSEALKFGIDPSLEPFCRMCEAMGNPQNDYACIQVAGSNGKSSTTRIIAALLRAQGLRVGLYVSPHLVKYPERIEVDGAIVDDQLFADGIEAALKAAEAAGLQATEFELLTAAALWIFSHERIDWAVLECGLGGRWDATSVVNPKVAVITGVALEHTEILGDTLEQIAGEKAAIIKPKSKVVFAHDLEAREVFEAQAKSVHAPFFYANLDMLKCAGESLDHLPEYQRANAATSLLAVNTALDHAVSAKTMRKAFANVTIPGRFEVLKESPLVIIDAAHNPQSAQTLAQELSARFVTPTHAGPEAQAMRAQGKRDIPTLLLGVLADKDARGVIRALCPLFFRVVVTASSSPRSLRAELLAKMVCDETGKVPEIAPSIRAANVLLKDEAVIATGSITVAGEVKYIW